MQVLHLTQFSLLSAEGICSSHMFSSCFCAVLQSLSGRLEVIGLQRTSAPSWNGAWTAKRSPDGTPSSDFCVFVESPSAKTVGVEERNEKQA